MTLTWPKRKSRLNALLDSRSDEDEDGLALDRILHGQDTIGKTAKTAEIESLRFSDKDLTVVGTLEFGQYGIIDVVNCRLDGRVYVRKSIEKKFALRTKEQCSPQAERDILLQATKTSSYWAPHLLCAFQTPTHLSLIMDYAEGGNLWDVLESSPYDGRIPEADLRWWAPQLCSAINWCHSQGFVHRDIKPHNFVLTPSSHILLIDFGSAAPLLPPEADGSRRVPKEHCLVPCGTCDYISPEVLQAHEAALVALEMSDDSGVQISLKDDEIYGLEVDWWSLGAMLYELAYGIAPFFASDIRRTYLKIMDYKKSLHFPEDVEISSAYIDLLRRLLTDQEVRLGRQGIMEITEHPFFESTNWSNLPTRSAPANLHLPQFEYAPPANNPNAVPQPQSPSLAEQSSHYSAGFAFSAFFQSSKDSISQPNTPSGIHNPNVQATPNFTPLQARATSESKNTKSILREPHGVSSFIGFSWGPSLDGFDKPSSALYRSYLSDYSLSAGNLATPGPSRIIAPPTHATPRFVDTPGPAPVSSMPRNTHPHLYTTPMRPSTLGYAYTPGVTHTLPRTGTIRRTAQRRAVSDREAMQQLIDCVGMSARKKVLESGRKPRILTQQFTQRSKSTITSFNRSRSGSGSGGPSSLGRPKELRFVPMLTAVGAANISDRSRGDSVSTPSFGPLPLLAPDADTTSEFESDGPPSPSPSPRPGSGMSRRSQTPTISSSSYSQRMGLLSLPSAEPLPAGPSTQVRDDSSSRWPTASAAGDASTSASASVPSYQIDSPSSSVSITPRVRRMVHVADVFQSDADETQDSGRNGSRGSLFHQQLESFVYAGDGWHNDLEERHDALMHELRDIEQRLATLRMQVRSL